MKKLKELVEENLDIFEDADYIYTFKILNSDKQIVIFRKFSHLGLFEFQKTFILIEDFYKKLLELGRINKLDYQSINNYWK